MPRTILSYLTSVSLYIYIYKILKDIVLFITIGLSVITFISIRKIQRLIEKKNIEIFNKLY